MQIEKSGGCVGVSSRGVKGGSRMSNFNCNGRKKFGWWEDVVFVFLLGFLRKVGCRTWFFCGRRVVKCVAKMVSGRTVFEG